MNEYGAFVGSELAVDKQRTRRDVSSVTHCHHKQHVNSLWLN